MAGYREWQKQNRACKRAGECEWRIFEDARAFTLWLQAMARQNVGVMVLERYDTPVCVRVRVDYC